MLSNIIKAEISKLNRLYKKDEKSIVAYLKRSDFNQFTIKKHKRNKWMSIKAKSEDENYIEIIHSGAYKFLIYSFTFSSARWTKTQINSSDTIGVLSTHNEINWSKINEDIKYTDLYTYQRIFQDSSLLYKKTKDDEFEINLKMFPFRNRLSSSKKYDFFGISKDFKMIRNYIHFHTVKLPKIKNKDTIAETLVDMILKDIDFYKHKSNLKGFDVFYLSRLSSITFDEFVLNNFKIDSKYLLPYILERYSVSKEEFLSFKNTEFYLTFVSKVNKVEDNDYFKYFFKKDKHD